MELIARQELDMCQADYCRTSALPDLSQDIASTRATPERLRKRCEMVIDSATLDPAHAYKLLIGSILPRAIG